MTEANDCVFCTIASGAFGTEFLVETDTVVAFKDIAPLAKDHVLVIPKRHIASFDDLGPEDDALSVELMDVARRVARSLGIDASGYRVVTNVGPDAGQSVFHLHVHVLGGEHLGGFGAR